MKKAAPQIWRLPPSAFLLAAQLLQLVLYSIFEDQYAGRGFLSAFGGLILVLVTWIVLRSHANNWVAWSLAIPAFILSILTAIIPNDQLLAWSALLEGILYFYAAGSLIAYMMQDDEVTPDELFAVGATFTLLAWGFAYLYLVCQTWLPGSFFSTLQPASTLSFIEMLFLSFTNLSATGWGDILPATTPARVLVMLEQFTGVGYVAIVVSRLIGLTILRKGRAR